MSDNKDLPDIIDIDIDIEPLEPGVLSPLSDFSASHSLLDVEQEEPSAAPKKVGKSPTIKEEPVDPFIGLTLKGMYRLDRKIGEGGMGNVYAATQFPLERQVAVKVLKPSESNPDGEHYFMREVQAINRLRHPNIISILDYGKEESGLLYLVMEHLPGRTLKEIIKQDYPLKPARVCAILSQLLSALEQAHNGGIIHCDLKPANIMIEEVAGQADFVKVLDFGIAKIKGPAMEVGPYTTAGNIVGTFDYMSPEQIMRRDLDGRADIWSVGVILYEMLTRKRLFHDKDAVSIIGRVMQMTIRRPSELVKTHRIPVILEEIALKAMERSLSKRFQSAGEMRHALLDAQQDLLMGDSGVHSHTGLTYHPGLNEASDSALSDNYSGPVSRSGPISRSGLVRGSTNSHSRSRPFSATDTGRPGLNSMYSRSGNFNLADSQNLGDSQRLATAIAQGTSILDQTFGIGELESNLMGERRKVVVLSVQQRARRRDGIDPEELARRSAQESALIREIVARFEGELENNLGGTFTILFGARRARVGDNLRAVECALALQNELRTLEHGAEHMGIALVYGEVYISDRRGGNAYGEAIDHAVDIARGVRDAKIFVDDQLIELTREQVLYDAPRLISGESVCEVLELTKVAVAAQENIEQELEDVDVYVPRPALFDELVRRATDVRTNSHGGGVAILGDLGTGKTVLLDHFVTTQQQAGWRIFGTGESSSKSHESLAPVRLWIRQIAATYKDPGLLIRKACEATGLKQNVDAAVQFFLGENSSADALPWEDPNGLMHFSSALLYRMMRFSMKTGPVMLVVDDLDVSDRLLMKFLENLLAGIQKQPVLLVATHRIESTALDHGLPGNFEILPIAGLNEGESRQLIAQMLGYTPPQSVVAQLHLRTSGNPMFLRELVRALRKQNSGRVLDDINLSESGIPLNLQELLAERIDMLPSNLRDLLAVASVLGEGFREDFFFQIVPSALNPDEGIQDLIALNVMEARFDSHQRVHVAFHPRAIRNIVYQRLPHAMREQIHNQIINFLENAPEYAAIDRLEHPLMLAFHYRSLNNFEGAAHYLVAAGQMMLDLYDYENAIEHIQDAIDLLNENQVAQTHPTLIQAAAHMLVALRESGRLEDAQRIIDQLPPLHDEIDGIDLPVRLELLHEKGLIEMEAGGIQRSSEDLHVLKEQAKEAGLIKLEIKALLALAQLFEKESQLPQAASLLMEVSQKVETIGDLDMHNPDDRKLCWTAYNQLGTLFIRQKDFQRAQQFLNAALQQARKIEDYRGLVRILSNLGALCLSIRDVKMATQYFKSAVSFAQGTGDLLNQSRILTNLGITSMEANDLEASKDYFRQARALAEEIGWYEGLAELSLHIRRLKKALQ